MTAHVILAADETFAQHYADVEGIDEYLFPLSSSDLNDLPSARVHRTMTWPLHPLYNLPQFQLALLALAARTAATDLAPKLRTLARAASRASTALQRHRFDTYPRGTAIHRSAAWMLYERPGRLRPVPVKPSARHRRNKR